MNNEIAYEQLIDYVVTSKHDLTTNLNTLITEPILAMSKEQAMSEIYLKKKFKDHEHIRELSFAINAFFGKEWRTKDNNVKNQAKEIFQHLQTLTTSYEKKIIEVSNYYKDCAKHKEYFSETTKGGRAYNAVQRAISIEDSVIKSLDKLRDKCTTEAINTDKYNLICLIQESFDDLKADLKYNNLDLGYEVKLDKNVFITHVLNNIRENIQNHAFGIPPFTQMFIWEKIVLIDFKREGDKIIVSISNNGMPFLGDENRIFEDGYYHGAKGHSGHGMSSARKYMRLLGGELDFHADKTQNAEYPVTLILTIPAYEKI